MRIAITADNHLTTRSKHPERFQALEDIFEKCGAEQVKLLIIAGDLFDQSLANYAEFEDLYQRSRPDGMSTVIIPGNHDRILQSAALAGEGLQVCSKPTLNPLDSARQVLFLPYRENLTMGEAIAPFADQLADQRWILVGHGDWSASLTPADPYEPGVYMPLTSSDIQRYQPELVFLGHIHLPQSSTKVHYPGSPCPLNITETGMRRFLLLDTTQGEITSIPVNSPLLYYDERFLMLPAKNDLELLERDIRQRIAGWKLPENWEDRVQVRVRIEGSSSSSRQKILSTAEELFSPYHFFEEKGPNVNKLLHSQDPDRAEIARQFQDWLNVLDWQESPDQPDHDLILEQALKVIYGVDS